MASPKATDEVASAVFQAASKLQEAVGTVRGLLDDEAGALGPAEEDLRENLYLVVESARLSLAAAHGISDLAATKLAATGEQAAAEVASSRKNDSMALSRRLQHADRPASHVVPILITNDTIRDSVKQHWYDEESPSMVLELLVRVEPPFNRLWRSVAAYFDTIRDAINEECDSVERNVETEADQDTEHTPPRPASDDNQRRGGPPGPALPRTPLSPITTPHSATPTIPESTTSHKRYPHMPQMHGALPPALSLPTPMQQFMYPGSPGLARQDSTGSGSFYRDTSLPDLAAATTPWPPVPSTQRYSPLHTNPNPSVSSFTEDASLTPHRHRHRHDDAHTSAKPYGVLDHRPALFPPPRPSQSPEDQHAEQRHQAAVSQQATAPKSKESRYQELRKGIMGKHNNAGRW